MLTKLSISQRIPIGLALIAAFALVLGSNRMDTRHYNEIHTRVNSLYQDRVVVQGYIHQLSNIFHEKELNIIRGKELTNESSVNEEVNAILNDFSQTELTREEAKRLNELEGLFEEYKTIEAGLTDGNNQAAAINTLHKIGAQLDNLVAIQLDESGKQTILSNDSLRMTNLLSKIEIAFLVVLGIGVLLLIFVPVKGGAE